MQEVAKLQRTSPTFRSLMFVAYVLVAGGIVVLIFASYRIASLEGEYKRILTAPPNTFLAWKHSGRGDDPKRLFELKKKPYEKCIPLAIKSVIVGFSTLVLGLLCIDIPRKLREHKQRSR